MTILTALMAAACGWLAGSALAEGKKHQAIGFTVLYFVFIYISGEFNG